MTNHHNSQSHIRKAYRALTQYRAEISHIMLDTPELARAYTALLFMVRVTVILAVITGGYTFTTTQSVTLALLAVGIIAVFAVLTPTEPIITGILTGGVILALQFQYTVFSLTIPTLTGALIISTILTTVIAAYLTRHAVIIASQLWEHKTGKHTSEIES